MALTRTRPPCTQGATIDEQNGKWQFFIVWPALPLGGGRHMYASTSNQQPDAAARSCQPYMLQRLFQNHVYKILCARVGGCLQIIAALACGHRNRPQALRRPPRSGPRRSRPIRRTCRPLWRHRNLGRRRHVAGMADTASRGRRAFHRPSSRSSRESLPLCPPAVLMSSSTANIYRCLRQRAYQSCGCHGTRNVKREERTVGDEVLTVLSPYT